MNVAMKWVQKVKDRVTNHKLKAYKDKAELIWRIGAASWTDEKLKAESARLKAAAMGGESLDELLPTAFAIACEASRRTLGLQPFEVQVMAGIALHEGHLVEMQTGEGKTLAAVLPAYLNALQGNGVHVLTFNDYLAERDASWMGPIYRFLGLTVGAATAGMGIADKKRAYLADVTYVTAKEAGFDYLRDAICMDAGDVVQRPFHYTIVDEADSLLIDEARVPLVIAGSMPSSGSDGARMAKFASTLRHGEHYDFDEHKRNVFLTDTGVHAAEAELRCDNLYDAANGTLLTSLNCALHAEALVKRDIDYIVRDGKLELIDPFTGRIAENRHWPDGLQAAVEAKEGLQSKTSGKILGTITLQHLLSLYPKISGMTATALASANEFKDTYELSVVVVPPNKPSVRADQPTLLFTHKEAKVRALVRDIAAVHATGRPILIGTSSVEESDALAEALAVAGVTCNVLNARNDAEEAEIVAKSGRLGAVTVSTNMAGRGVDIRLGGGEPAQADTVAKLGGLYVIGTHMNESLRIDNQLRGRAGRQGDPGSSRFYVSLADELFVRYGTEKAIPPAYRERKQDEPLAESALHKGLDHIQRIVMGQNFDIRRELNRYSDMVEEQRQILYAERASILGDETRGAAEKRVRLFYIDKAWADHLAYVSYIREAIHLESLANRNPLDEFHARIIQAFEKLPEQIEKDAEKLLAKLDKTKDDHDWAKLGLQGPASTWTYIMNDQYIQKPINIFG
ncbi:accessory Sec system translocase SecA2 [Cohnella sp. GCM10027633]|uniref:preprotein translocase subunit SecA n=1 Tax=unclassified Cohnella TaxID=2636738 RepID=UPI003643063B